MESLEMAVLNELLVICKEILRKLEAVEKTTSSENET